MATNDLFSKKQGDEKVSFPAKVVQQFGSLEEGIAWFQKNLHKEPVDYRLNLQVLLNLIGREQEAFQMSEEMMMIAPDDPRILFNRGWHLIHRDKFHEGFSLLENGRQFGGYGESKPLSPMPILHRNMPIVEGSHVLLHTEGGFGDEIINLRFVENIHRRYGVKTIVACQRSLVPLFARNPYVAAAVDKQHVHGVYHDYWLPAMSAPAAMCESIRDVGGKPYLFVDKLPNFYRWQELVEKNRDPNKKLKVGLRWAGSPKFEHQQYRKFPPELVLDLARKNPNVQFYSFQRDNDMMNLPEEICDLSPFMQDWADTASGLALMDLVITSCTSIAHCAGALGVNTWVVTPVLPYYIWATPGDKSPWYDSVTLFRQGKFGNWDDIKQKLSRDFKSWVQSLNTSDRKAG